MNLRDIDMFDVVRIAREAGALIMSELDQTLDIEAKADESPVTNADKHASALVKERLQALTPNTPILSEEDIKEEQLRALQSPVHWVLDPLDGTRTAIAYAQGKKTHDQFGVHIAMVVDGVPERGVVFFPAKADGQGVCYYTGNNGSAYRIIAENTIQKLNVARPPFGEKGMRGVVHHHPHRRAEKIAGREYATLCGVGGERLCQVAEGYADIADMNDIVSTPERKNGYKQWDLAASHAIVKAAGGEVVDSKTGHPLRYDGEDFILPGAYAASRETLKLLGIADLPTPAHARYA